MSEAQDRDSHTDEKGNPVPNPELRGYYVMIVFFIFGELVIIWLCSFIVSPDNRYLAIVTGTVSYMVFLAMLEQTRVSEMQWQAMREQQVIMSDTLQHARDALDMIERPNIVVTHASFVGNTYPKLAPQITIANKGRTEALHIRMQFGVAEKPLLAFEDERTFEDEYPGHTSPEWCQRFFLGSGDKETLTYDEADRVTVEKPPVILGVTL